MRCPFCGHEDTQVRDSRPTEDAGCIRRRRQCAACEARFTTFERVQLRDLIVVKRSGKRAPFDRDKLQRSVMIALRKRNVDPERVEKLVSDIQRKLEGSGELEVNSATIGGLVMDALRALDPVAYVRYASVYRDFQDAADFKAFLDKELSAGEA